MTARLHVDLPEGALAAGRTIALPDGCAHHALRALRMRDGDAVTLFDGRGGEWRASLVVAGRRDAHARIASDAMDSAVRKAVELGAAAIAPVVAARSQGATQGAKRAEHWRRIAIAACEQCGRNRIPPIADPVPLSEWLGARAQSRAGIALVPGATKPLGEIAVDRALDLAIGPEGGWTPEETRALGHHGFIAASIGPRILRADTACVAALSVVLSSGGGLR